MAVYVDDMQAEFRGMKMSHMMADTHAELLAMADQIGVDRKWLQKPGTVHEHFDIAESKKRRAIRAGAVQVTRKQLGDFIMARRGARILPLAIVAARVDQVYQDHREEWLAWDRRKLAGLLASGPVCVISISMPYRLRGKRWRGVEFHGSCYLEASYDSKRDEITAIASALIDVSGGAFPGR